MRLKPLWLHPLSPEDALRGAMEVPPHEGEARKVKTWKAKKRKRAKKK
jgi:hypothetical protein